MGSVKLTSADDLRGSAAGLVAAAPDRRYPACAADV